RRRPGRLDAWGHQFRRTGPCQAGPGRHENARARGPRGPRARLGSPRVSSGSPGSSRIAVDRVARQVGVEAERAETGRLWEADHGERASVVLAVERSHGWLRRAGLASAIEGNLRVVEPEADVERVGRIEPDDGVEPEDLVDEDGLDGGHVAVVVLH